MDGTYEPQLTKPETNKKPSSRHRRNANPGCWRRYQQKLQGEDFLYPKPATVVPQALEATVESTRRRSDDQLDRKKQKSKTKRMQ
jgi:hypothetical protein